MRRIRLGFALCTLIISAQASAESQQMSSPSVKAHRTTGSTKEAADLASQAGQSYLNNIFNSTNRPDWLTRTYISYAVQHRNTPIGEILTTQPLYEDCWNTLFWQGRVAYTDGDGTGNLGLGYRYITDDKKMMWGVNTFFDETMHYKHKRAGLGGEFFTTYLTFRANYYNALSRSINVGADPISGITSYQRALTGYDASIETPVPYVSWMRFIAQGYRWRGNKTSGLNGGEAMLRIFPARQVEIDAGASVDNVNGTSTFLKLDYYFGSPAFIENSASTTSYNGMYAPVDLEKQRLQKVIRHNDIVLETTNNGISGSGIIVARGT